MKTFRYFISTLKEFSENFIQRRHYPGDPYCKGMAKFLNHIAPNDFEQATFYGDYRDYPALRDCFTIVTNPKNKDFEGFELSNPELYHKKKQELGIN